jgi:hypothetical protein
MKEKIKPRNAVAHNSTDDGNKAKYLARKTAVEEEKRYCSWMENEWM